jgi:hypothetical protein
LDPPDLEVQTKKKRKRLMSNNLIRKGLAIGAAASLALAGLVGISAPATANPGTPIIQSSFGATSAIQTSMTQNAVLGYEFNLHGTFPGIDANTPVKYLIEGTNVKAASITVSSRFVSSLSVAADNAVSSESVYREGGAQAGYHTRHTVRNVSGSTSKVVLVPNFYSSTPNRLGQIFQFKLNLSDTLGATTEVTVTPFIDSVGPNNDVIEASLGEIVGTPIKVTFHKDTEVTATAQLQSFNLGSSQTVKATATVNKDVNVAQFVDATSSPVLFQFTNNGVATTSNNNRAIWNSTTSVLEGSQVFTTIAAGNVIAVQVKVGTAAFGGAQSAANAAGQVSALTAVTAASNGSVITETTFRVRSGAGSFSASTTATVTTGSAKAGQKVTFKITEGAGSGNLLDAGASIVAGGKTLKNSSSTNTTESISVEVLTDATGKATLPLTYTGLKAGNQFQIEATAVGATEISTGASSTFTGEDSAPAALYAANVVGNNPVLNVARGGQVAIDYRLVDKWGQTPVGTWRLAITLSGATKGAVHSSNVAITNGAGSLRFNDTSDANDSYSVVADLFKQNAVSLAWEDFNANGVDSTSTSIKTGEPAPATATLDANISTQDIARVPFVAVDTRATQKSVAVRAPSAFISLSGTLLAATGLPSAGQSITLSSSSNVYFLVNDQVYAAGSVTLNNKTNGTWDSVKVFSNVAGKKTITVRSGSAVKTVDVTFVGATADEGDSIVITAPKSHRAGRTLTMTVKILDEYGNGVPAGSTLVGLTYDGPGFVTTDLASAAMSAAGTYTVRVLLSAGDTGPAILTAEYAPTTLASAAAADIVTVTSATWVGPIANATAGAKKGRVVVDIYRAKGKSYTVLVGKTVVATGKATKANFKRVITGVKKGDRNVTVRLTGGTNFKGSITVK